LQAEVRRLQDTLEERRLHRLESSETLIQDARIRLESLHNSVSNSANLYQFAKSTAEQIGQTAFLAEQTELTSVLESLVNDNETLKRDNAELQHLLTESREEIHVLQGEVEEQRANPPRPVGKCLDVYLIVRVSYLLFSWNTSLEAPRTAWECTIILDEGSCSMSLF
jgi:hypothetical protein